MTEQQGVDLITRMDTQINIMSTQLTYLFLGFRILGILIASVVAIWFFKRFVLVWLRSWLYNF